MQKKVSVLKDHVQYNAGGGTALIKIPTNTVCQHSFFAYIDKNFVVRDYLELQYSVDDAQKHLHEILQYKLKDFGKIKIDLNYLLEYIEDIDLRSLIYACFIESPIIIIETDFEHDRFIMLMALLKTIFPQMLETCLFFTPEDYLTYAEKHPEKIEHFTIYNLAYKISVQKPFLDSKSEPLQNRLYELCLKNSKMEFVLCKNKFDYLAKFSKEINDFPGTDKAKLAKIMKKKYPEHEDLFSIENIALMRDRLNFTHLLSFPDLDPSASIGPIFIWNEAMDKSKIEGVSNVIEKLCLNAIQQNQEISVYDLELELQKFAVVKMAKISANSLIELLNKYCKKNWLTKK